MGCKSTNCTNTLLAWFVVMNCDRSLCTFWFRFLCVWVCACACVISVDQPFFFRVETFNIHHILCFAFLFLHCSFFFEAIFLSYVHLHHSPSFHIFLLIQHDSYAIVANEYNFCANIKTRKRRKIISYNCDMECEYTIVPFIFLSLSHCMNDYAWTEILTSVNAVAYCMHKESDKKIKLLVF